MALHAPSHHVPHINADSHRLLRDTLIALALAVAVLLVFGAALSLRTGIPQFLQAQPETAPLVEFRAGERDSYVAGQTSEGQSIIVFRAAERTGR